MGRLLRAAFTVICLVLVPAAASAQSRQLFWERLDVTAHLDATGALAVTESHVINFSGDWNGGERIFDLRGRQRLDLRGMWRVDGAGRRAMREDASLDDVDDYARADRNHLRWRARRPSDPRFNRTVLRYEIQYVLTGILDQAGDGYQLNHDFAFPQRTDRIDAFTLRLTLDPAWQAPADFPAEFTSGRIAPGRGYVVTVPLRFVGGVPPAIAPPDPAVVPGIWLLLGLTLATVAWFFVKEHAIGRFAPVPTGIDERWLYEHVLAHRPEVVGAAWDGKVGSDEVTALLSRLEREGKISSHAGADGLTLRLIAARETFEGYERTLIDKLFFDGRSETTPEAVRAWYETVGFDPAASLSAPIADAVERILPAGTPPRAQRRWVTLGLAVAGALLLMSAGQGDGLPIGLAVLALLVVFLLIGGGVTASRAAGTLHWGRLAVLLCLLPAVALAGLVAAAVWFLPDFGVLGDPPLGLQGVAGVVALALAFVRIIVGTARTRVSAEVLRFRKALVGARRYFVSELRTPHPALRDDWIPWLIAFGLGPRMDAWDARRVTQAGEDADGEDSRQGDSSWTSSSPGATSSWTGFGGGRSGGAGATAGWAAAAAFAAPVSPPASSSSGDSGDSGSSWSSSSDSGSSSSGGGGGGGW